MRPSNDSPLNRGEAVECELLGSWAVAAVVNAMLSLHNRPYRPPGRHLLRD